MQIDIADIRLDGGTQPRAMYHVGVAESYAEDMEAGAVFPPVTVFFDGTDYWLADGFHRILAVEKNEQATIEADVRQGTQQDAQWHSYSVNQAHGLRRSNDDKRRAVEAALAHPRSAGMTDEAIAQHVGVDQKTVWNYRNNTDTRKRNTKENPKSTENGYRTGKDGVKRKAPSKKPKQQPAPSARQEDDEELTPYEQQIAAAHMNGSSAPAITEPASIGDARINQMINELIQQLNFADFRRFIELAAERIAVDV